MLLGTLGRKSEGGSEREMAAMEGELRARHTLGAQGLGGWRLHQGSGQRGLRGEGPERSLGQGEGSMLVSAGLQTEGGGICSQKPGT